MTISLLLAGAGLLILGMILGLKTLKPIYLNVAAGLIILIGTFFGIFGKQLQDKSSSEKSDQILKNSTNTSEKIDLLKLQNDSLTTQAIDLNEKIEKQAVLIDNLRQENTSLYDKLAKQATNIMDNVKGKGYLSLLPIDFSGAKNEASFGFYNKGDYPIYDLSVVITDFQKVDELKSKGFDEAKAYLQSQEKHRFDMIGKGYIDIVGKLDIGKRKNAFAIDFVARNGMWRQLLNIINVDNKWESLSYVFTVPENKLLEKTMTKNYPPNELIESAEKMQR
jgi:uncharacterized membrane-anchored protein YhcB (DUF1043 family)